MDDFEEFTSDEESQDELLEYNSDEEEYEDEIADETDDESNSEEEAEEEIEDFEAEEEPEEEEEAEEEEENEDLSVDMFDDRQAYQPRKREFKLDKKNILNQFNKFKFMSVEKDEIVKKEMTNFTPSEKNINIFCNNIKCHKTKAVDILRNMFFNTLSLKEILGEIREDKTLFESILWDNNREIIKKEVMALQTKIEVVDSFISCPKCKQKKIQFYNVQLRRADEPPTTFNNCMNKDCLYSWRTG
jgi:DNA-directed RNA polymerase subunit M/transcription elongation factor TFIIS